MPTKDRTEAPKAAPEPQESTSTAVAAPMDDQLLQELLDAQQASLSGNIDLPNIRIAPGGVGFYEFPDENEMLKEFKAVILGAHDRNALWITKMGEQQNTVAVLDDDTSRRPECSSPDGKFGRPKKGFRHAMLGDQPATGDERIACGSCIYNKFGSGAMFIKDKNPKGKAVSNRKDVYLFLPNRRFPFRLSLSSKSLQGYEEYVQKLTKRSQPVQAIITTFRQVVGDSNGAKFGIATFEPGPALDGAALAAVLKMRRDFIKYIEPQPLSTRADTEVTGDVSHSDDNEPDFTIEDAGNIPVGDEKVPF